MSDFPQRRVAIVHYWLLGMRGGEKVVEALCRLIPGADIFTLFYDPERVSPLIRSRNVRASFLNPLRGHYRPLLPLMPLALESFDLRGYDLVISSESGPAKGVIVPSTARHICYCHTPMRYVWDLYPDYLHDFTKSRWKRALMAPLANYLRMWDYTASARVDDFIANSANVQRRIWKAYRRESEVIYPPVAVDRFYSRTPENYFLIVSEFVAYKRLDYAVRLFAKRGIPLKLVGHGPEEGALRELAGSQTEFLGRVSDSDLRELYARCRALIVPGKEDFGMNMVEALASGKPVIALGGGGAAEIVDPDCGILYPEPAAEALDGALRRFDVVERDFRSAELRAAAARFSEAQFDRRMSEVISRCEIVPASSAPMRR